MTGLVPLALATLVSFGLPETPDVPGVPDLPELDIPGIPVLEEVASELDGLSASLDGLEGLIPDVALLDEASTRLRELNDLDPEVAALVEDLEAYRAEIVAARDRLASAVAEIDSKTASIRERVEEIGRASW